MDLAAEMMVHVECRTGHEAILSDLMIAVIERFTPWRSFPLTIRVMNISTQDPRIRRAAEVIALRRAAISILPVSRRRPPCRGLIFFAWFNLRSASPRRSTSTLWAWNAVYAALHLNFRVGEIGERLGFAEPEHFTRFFRNHAGVCPREFRSVSRLASWCRGAPPLFEWDGLVSRESGRYGVLDVYPRDRPLARW